MRRFLAIVLAATSLAACAAERPVPTEPAATAASAAAEIAAFVPLAVGNRWTYVTRFADKVERNTVQIEREEGGFFRDNQRGALSFDGEGLRDEQRYLILGPLRAGRSWESLLPGGKRERYEILRTDATVEVPAGRFERVLLVRGVSPIDAGTDLEVEWAWAPGVGLIRMETTARIGKERTPQARIELESFQLSR